MTEQMPSPFQPTSPPPVSPAAVQRPPRKSAKKAAKKTAAPKKARAPRVPKTLHAVTDAEIAAGAAKKARKKRKAKVTITAPSGMEFYARTKKLISEIAAHTGSDEAAVEKMFRKLMP